MKQAFILAAGLGTRLKPLTDRIPKALVPIGGKPLLHHVMQRLIDAGFERVVINVHHFAEQIIDDVRLNDRFGIDVRISDERDLLLETGGGLRHAAHLFEPDSPILIHNVDILSNVDLSALYDQGAKADAALLVSERKTSRYLLFNDAQQLQGWTNISTGELRGPALESGTEGLHPLAFAGIHVFSPTLFPLMYSWPERFSIIDFYLSICADHKICGYIQPDMRMLDVGKVDSLATAESFIK